MVSAHPESFVKKLLLKMKRLNAQPRIWVRAFVVWMCFPMGFAQEISLRENIDLGHSAASFVQQGGKIYFIGVGVTATQSPSDVGEKVRRIQVAHSKALAEMSLLLDSRIRVEKKLSTVADDQKEIEILSVRITEKSQQILKNVKAFNQGLSEDGLTYYVVLVSEVSAE
jgi:hypothetical protein